MFNTLSLEAVQAARSSDGFTKPLPDSYSFARIPGTIRELFGVSAQAKLPESVLEGYRSTYDRVVLFFIDGFGWCFLERLLESGAIPELTELCNRSRVSQLTSQFPSTTAVHVTTMHTGVPVGESGVLEWYYYESRLDRVICPLLFCVAGDKGMNGLLQFGANAGMILPANTHYGALESAGVRVTIVQPKDYLKGEYDRVASPKARKVGYQNYLEGLGQVTSELTRHQTSHYVYYYFPHFDETLHRQGPDSPEGAEILKALFVRIQQQVIEPLSRLEGNTLLLFTADHGMTSMDPATTFYVDREIPEIATWIRRDRRGDPIAPAGGPRDFFLHLEADKVDAAFELLTQKLEGKAVVARVHDLIDQGYFGSSLSKPFLDNVGDLVVLGFEGQSVFWLGPQGRFEQSFYGHHGGLTHAEMEIPLIACEL